MARPGEVLDWQFKADDSIDKMATSADTNQMTKETSDNRSASNNIPHDQIFDSQPTADEDIDKTAASADTKQTVSESVAAEKQKPHFLGIAPEIRNKIYEHLLESPDQKVEAFENSSKRARFEYSAKSVCPNILATCRKIQEEATSILYGANTIFLALDEVSRFFDLIDKNVRLLRRIKIRLFPHECVEIRLGTGGPRCKKYKDAFRQDVATRIKLAAGDETPKQYWDTSILEMFHKYIMTKNYKLRTATDLLDLSCLFPALQDAPDEIVNIVTLLSNFWRPTTYTTERALALLVWIDKEAMRSFRKALPHLLTDHEKLLLTSIVNFLERQLSGARSQELTIALSSSILIELLCRFEIPLHDIRILLDYNTTTRPFLAAAGVLKLEMAVNRILRCGSINNGDSNMKQGPTPWGESFDDPRFKEDIINDDGLCTLPLAEFLREVCHSSGRYRPTRKPYLAFSDSYTMIGRKKQNYCVVKDARFPNGWTLFAGTPKIELYTLDLTQFIFQNSETVHTIDTNEDVFWFIVSFDLDNFRTLQHTVTEDVAPKMESDMVGMEEFLRVQGGIDY